MSGDFSSSPGKAQPGLFAPGNPGSGIASPVIVAQWPVTAQGTYGLQSAAIGNADGNALIAIVGCGLNSQALVPRFNIADDANNWWIFAGSKVIPGSVQANRRVDVWVAPNARAASNVSVAESWYTSGVAGVILEVAGFPAYASVDFAAVVSGTGISAAVSGNASAEDVLIGALLLSGAGTSVSVTSPAVMATLSPVTTGSSVADMTSQALYPAAALAAPGAVSETWSWTGSQKYAAIVVGFSRSPAAPVQPNPNWPTLKAEAAFGFQPGNVGAMPVWTDITSRVVDEEGQANLKASRGREYELTQPEAGSLTMNLLNHDGAFNPANTGSPYYPNVLPQVPVRVTATIGGRTYPVGFSYADKWPQDFPDPHWGMTSYKGSDGIGIASQVKLPSAYAGEILLDSPYSYHPLGEFFTPAAGQRFANLSRTNLLAAIGIDDTARAPNLPLATGMQMNLAGDPSTGIGFSGSTRSNDGGPGAFYRDNGLPALSSGFMIEFWGAVTQGSAGGSVDIMSVMGMPSSHPVSTAWPWDSITLFQSTGEGSRLKVTLSNHAVDGAPAATVALANYGGNQVYSIATSGTGDSLLHHFVVSVSLSGGTWTLLLWMDGALAASGTTTSVTGTLDSSLIAMGRATLGGGYHLMADYTLGQVAAYGYLLGADRISAHYATGSAGGSGDSTRSRFAKLYAWSGTGLPIASLPSSPSPLIGPADQIQGQAISDAAYNLSVDDGGMYYCSGAGTAWYAPRASFYNKTPKWVFGDNPSNGECPYLPQSGFDFDNSFLWNVVSSQRTISASNEFITSANGKVSNQQFNSYGADAIQADLGSEAQYMPRGPLQQDIETTSDQDAFDRANWSLVKYRQPQLRASKIVLDPASNPAVWPVALGVEQGDIVRVIRRPIGAPAISLLCIVQKIEHQVGPSMWRTTLSLSPYYPEGAVIQLGVTAFDTPASGILGW